eukprot:scaffold6029_cov63-Phaeocystis_antarctica.AAC.4
MARSHVGCGVASNPAQTAPLAASSSAASGGNDASSKRAVSSRSGDEDELECSKLRLLACWMLVLEVVASSVKTCLWVRPSFASTPDESAWSGRIDNTSREADLRRFPPAPPPWATHAARMSVTSASWCRGQLAIRAAALPPSPASSTPAMAFSCSAEA